MKRVLLIVLGCVLAIPSGALLLTALIMAVTDRQFFSDAASVSTVIFLLLIFGCGLWCLLSARRRKQALPVTQVLQRESGMAEAAPTPGTDWNPSEDGTQLFQQATAEDVPEGISYAKLSYLDAEALKFWNGKRTDFEIPQYYRHSAFGRNVRPALARLLDRGYLALGDDEQRISLQKVPELRAILAERELKSSGTKKELVARLLNSLEPEEISELFPVNVYCITETGRAALAPYSLLDVNSAYSLGLSSYRLLQAREEHPTEPDNVTITRLLSDDLQACSRSGDRSGYQMTLAKTARFMQGVGEAKIALECNILAFFMWTEEMSRMNLSVSGPQGYYMAKNVEEAAQICGCEFSELLQAFREVIRRINPFSLGTKGRIEQSIQDFTKLLGIQ